MFLGKSKSDLRSLAVRKVCAFFLLPHRGPINVVTLPYSFSFRFSFSFCSFLHFSLDQKVVKKSSRPDSEASLIWTKPFGIFPPARRDRRGVPAKPGRGGSLGQHSEKASLRSEMQALFACCNPIEIFSDPHFRGATDFLSCHEVVTRAKHRYRFHSPSHSHFHSFFFSILA